MSNTETQQTVEITTETIKNQEIKKALKWFWAEEQILEEEIKKWQEGKENDEIIQGEYTWPWAKSVQDFIKQPNKKELSLRSQKLDNDSLWKIFKYLEQKWCIDRVETLDCSSNNLTSLPTLPNNLKILFCNYNKLTKLPKLPKI